MTSSFFKLLTAAFLLASSPAMADWSANAISQGHTAPGATGQVVCPSGGVPSSVWGTGTYTSDSSICGAAQHYGWLASGAGGTVTYQTVPGMASYEGSSNYGITSRDYGSWNLSFQITGYTPTASGPIAPITWRDTPDGLGHGSAIGTILHFACGPNSAPLGTIWGVGPYTSDSPVCVAAQHRGLITGAGGTVTVVITGPMDSFASSTAYGVTSSSYPAWPRSYTFQ